jgi:hypothetical protein
MTAANLPVWTELRGALERAAPQLLAITENVATVRPGAGKWSCKEVIGHLIDSATNNHGRFVRAQLKDELVFEGYDQDAWMRVQRYQERKWPELVSLWRELNLQIAHVMQSMSAHDRLRTRTVHNLHQIAWRAVPESTPTTLEYFLRDYIGHMEHHLRQVATTASVANSPQA